MLKSISKKIKYLCRSMLSVCELIFWRYCLPRRPPSSEDTVMLIQDCHVGDFIISLPFFQRISAFYGKKLTLVSDKRIESLARACGCFEEFIAVDMKRASSYRHLLCRWQTLWSLREYTANILIKKYSVGSTALEDCMAVVIPANRKTGVDSSKTFFHCGRLYAKILNKNFDQLYSYDPQLNLLENENAFCNMICCSRESECVGDLKCFEPLPELDISSDYALFITGADDPRRRWDPEKFACTATKYLEKNPDKQVLFSGSPAEREIIQDVLKAVPQNLHARIKIREPENDYLLAIKRLMSDCKHAEFVLTGETAPLHIAAKYKTRCYCLSGGWHYNIFAPWKAYSNTTYFQEYCEKQPCNGECIFNLSPFKCLNDLSAEKVLNCIVAGND